MSHNGSNPNEVQNPVTLCRMGCGFYGSPQFDGMCSKCSKDALKRRQQSSSPTQLGGRMSPAVGASLSDTSERFSLVRPPSIASVETAIPTVPTPSTPTHDKDGSEAKSESDDTALAVAVAVAAAASIAEADDKEKKPPKKNRCHMCKKKVGLTGFPCRCGGLFCSMHRYSDKHECTFDYQKEAQEQIRKNNPVVVGSKIQKI